MTFNVSGKTIFISGASQGLGETLANQLHALGANIVLLARSKAKLQIITDIHNDNKFKENQWSKYYSIDLANALEYEAFMEWISLNKITPDVLICCAGSSIPKLFTDLTIDELSRGIDINYKTCVYLIHYMVPLMKKNNNDERHIVILSSAVAFYSFIGYSQYSPMKAALRSLGDALSHELNPFNIHVHTVYPGNFSSEGYAEENLTKPSITMEIEGGSVPISVDQCCDIVLNGLGFKSNWLRSMIWPHGQRYIFTDLLSWVMYTFCMGFSPRDFFGLEIILGIIGLLFGRFIDMFHEYLIKKWFSNGVNHQN